ncbi:MAG: hypothetical protein ACOCWQ_05910 [Nanoarchaeota archaeon]
MDRTTDMEEDKTMAAEDALESAEEGVRAVRKKTEEARKNLGRRYADARMKLQDNMEKTRTNIRRHPGRAIAISAAAGAVVGGVVVAAARHMHRKR